MGRAARLGLAVGWAAVSCAVAALAVGRRVRSRRRWGRVLGVLREFEEGCSTPIGRLRQVVDAMAVEMHAGLASDGGSKLKMLLTYVDALPDGTEKGMYYALDLGGANFRVLRVQLGSGGPAAVPHRTVTQAIPWYLMTSTTEDLFNFVATTLAKFIESEEDEVDPSLEGSRELGFTFSFPMRQSSISSGKLIRWTKGFAIDDTVDKDVAVCLEEALQRAGVNMRVAAMINDTVGTLALGHYHDEDTVVAVIMGSGTNACYLERTDAIIKRQGLLTSSGNMVINMEWGNFWSSHLPRTPYDVALDDDSPNRNDQGFEKMISGMYLGDIVRRVILRMVQELDIFGAPVANLSIPFILRTPQMAAMHEDASPDLSEVSRILKELLQIQDFNIPLKTRRLVVSVCDVVTRRAARLAAAGIVGILKKMGRDGSGGVSSSRVKGRPRRTVIAIEGGLYEYYPLFRAYLNEAIYELLPEEVGSNVVLRVCQDGSGIGAALLAASHSANHARPL